MSTFAQAWHAISPTPVEKGVLIQPEATDRFAPRPWLGLPPGALTMFGIVAAAALAASLQAGVEQVRREGLPVELPLPALEVLRPTDAQLARRPHARRTKGRLHRVLGEVSVR